MNTHLFPVADLSHRWSITPNTVSRRLAFLNIKPVRRGNFRFITQNEFDLANRLHFHIQTGQPMATFLEEQYQSNLSAFSETLHINRNKKISKSLRWTVLERDGYKCRACGATNCLEIDHIVPRSKGGPTIESNLQVLCADCNRGKGTSMPIDKINGISLKELEARWSLSRNALKGRAAMLGIELTRISSTLTIWPEDKLILGDQLHAYIQEYGTSEGFYCKTKTQQFNVRIDVDLLTKFKNKAYARGVLHGLDASQSVNKAVHKALQWYIETTPD